MRRFPADRVFITVIVCILASLLVSCSDDDCVTCPPCGEKGGWIVQETPTTESLTKMAVIDSRTVVASGLVGTVVRTGDGGATWKTVPTGTTETLRDVYFLDETHGWIVGDNGTALASTDAGASWTPFTVPTVTHLREIIFTDTETGFIGGGPIGSETGNPVLLKTVDGGLTWTASDFPFTIRTMFFADPDHGFAGGGDQLVRTTDGGESWEPSPHGHTGWLGCVYFAGVLDGWVSGGGGFVAVTHDGGLSWETQNSGTTRNVIQIFALDAARCWYVARSPGALAATNDGGVTWEFQTLPAGSIPSDVAFADSLTGWVCGLEGLILKTTTGGW